MLITFMICDDCTSNSTQSIQLENSIDLCPIVTKGKFSPVGCSIPEMEIYSRYGFSPMLHASHDYNLILIVGENPIPVVKAIWEKTDYMGNNLSLENVGKYMHKNPIDAVQFYRFNSEICSILEALPDNC